jgi:plasmid stabilization system protein ParE
MIELLIAEPAEEEYTASLQWYADRSKQAAEGFEADFAQGLRAIEANPETYPSCDDGRHHFYLLRRYPFQLI